MIFTLGAIWLRLLLTLLLLELHVPIMHHSTSQLVNGHFLFSCEAQNIDRLLCRKVGKKSDFKATEKTERALCALIDSTHICSH